MLPAGVPAELEARAEALAADLIAKLGMEGLLCAEIFVTRNGELFVNELAPRPHNSYHQSERGCVTSQFEQLVRAVCNLPLGDTSLIISVRDRESARRCVAEGRAGFCGGAASARRAAASLREAHAARGAEDGAFVGDGSDGGRSAGAGAGGEAAALVV